MGTREMRNPAFKRKVIEENGACCANCGSAEAIEYHHIVPVLLGGTNRITNIIPLCHRCHEAAHRGRHIAEYRNLKRTGRKTKLSDEEAFKVFDLYIDGQIGNKRCRELFGYKGTIITRTEQFKRYLEKNGIEKVRNNVDVVAVNSPDRFKDGCPVGEIEYIDGRREPIYFKDTGMNAVEYRQREIHENFPIWKKAE